MSDMFEDIDNFINDTLCNDPEFADMYFDTCNKMLSDARLKHLRHKYEGNELDADALAYLLEQTQVPEEDRGSDDVLDKYAEHIRNYLYTYKPEATSIDNSINPEEEQIGIMAQDLEKVNPACVQETPEGIKVVDTRKLALMNAGAIGDIARRLISLEGALHING